MTSTVLPLLFGVHAHQPIGNFTEVIDNAVARCYHPFLAVLAQYPEFPFALHSSGWLLGELAQRHPQTLELLVQMVRRGQVELVGAGDTEPVLAAIPHIDRIGQLEAMKNRLQRDFGYCPRGAWLTERVWDPSVVPALAASGIRYVMVDDYHFLCAGLPAEALGGFYRTEENGAVIDVFPISEALRYRVPFSEVPDTLAFLAQWQQGSPGSAAIYFDDIEKFGLWPETYDWVYHQGWLARFIEAVLAAPWVQVSHFATYQEQHRPLGVIYLPTVSYSEMNEWTLAPQSAREYAALRAQEREAGRLERRKALIRGGTWKNFLHRYPESNWMHKRMLQLSARLHALPDGKISPSLLADLHAAQANDAYWHGLFGGIYLPHLRRAIYRHLTRLEAGLDILAPRPAIEDLDVDLDGALECFYQDGFSQVVIHEPYASLQEWLHYPSKHNFADTLARRDEAYYDKVRAHGASPEHSPHSGIVSAHDRVSFKAEIGEEDLVFDPLPCQSFLDHWQEQALSYSREPGYQSPSYLATQEGLQMRKSFRLEQGMLTVSYTGTAHHGAAGQLFSTRLYLAMPSCDGPGGCLWVDGQMQGGFGKSVTGVARKLVLTDAVLGGEMRILLSRMTSWKAWAHRTVSQSEAGFEKIMQAWVLELSWELGAENDFFQIQAEVRRA
ncbi:MAG: DUF1926 domain-containing protein [Acidithiobacillus sp.]|nr:DUF1926 domain-containing protein [Acidithiobacillus sp.]